MFQYFTIVVGLQQLPTSGGFSFHGSQENQPWPRQSFQLRSNRISHGALLAAMAAGAAWQRCLRQVMAAAGLSLWDPRGPWEAGGFWRIWSTSGGKKGG